MVQEEYKRSHSAVYDENEFQVVHNHQALYMFIEKYFVPFHDKLQVRW